MRRLVQFSLTTCQPCHMAKHRITKDINPPEGKYEYVNLSEGEAMDKWRPFLVERGIRKVPYFVVFEGENVIETFFDSSLNKLKEVFASIS